jgi:hypothetical protein
MTPTGIIYEMLATDPASGEPWIIEIGPSTELLLADRMPGNIADLASGDSVNIYGQYIGDGMVRADIIRDLSKPESPTLSSGTVTELSQPTGTGTAF